MYDLGRLIRSETRKVEIFTADCPLCAEAEKTIRELACKSCIITVLNMQEPLSLKRARELGVKSVPAVAINDKLIGCCARQGIDEDALREAGLGKPI
jgi:glutaredoxin